MYIGCYVKAYTIAEHTKKSEVRKMENTGNFVTDKQCEERRAKIIEENARQTRDISKLFGETRALSENVKHLVDQNKWFMGIIAAVLGGLLLWLITKS